MDKVKLVVADMDGTLLNDRHEVSERFFELYDSLKNDIHFVAASGRQYQSIIAKLTPIKNEITVIAENGGITMRGEKVLDMNVLKTEKVHQLIKSIRDVPNSFTVLCGKKSAYVESENKSFIDVFSEYYSAYKLVDDLCSIEDDTFFKIAVYHFEDSEKYLYPAVKDLENEFQIKISGRNWLDISAKNVNKGLALKHIQQELDISPRATMAFGDFNNDIEMLRLAHFSYAMENAHENVKKTAKYATKSNNEDGVEHILQELLAAKSKFRTP